MKDPISYEQALEIVKKSSDKMLMFIFVRDDCPICSSFVPEVMIPEIENNLDDIDYYIIDTKMFKMYFPPVSYPAIYYFIPGSTEEMPIMRSGGTTDEIFKFDLSRILKVKQGMSLIEAFS
jgi:hypothetical protein